MIQTAQLRTIATCLSVTVFVASALSQPRYDFILVDSLNANPLAGEAYVWDINDVGMACGVATVDNVPGYPGIVWTEADGRVRISVATPRCVNNLGLVVGIGDILDLASNTIYTPPNLPGTYYAPSFGGVNDAGVAVGTISGCSCSDSGGVLQVPYIWDAVNGARTISVPNARGLSRINEAGIAIGWLNGWVMNDGFIIDINTGVYTILADVFPTSIGSGPIHAADINDSGVVAGSRAGIYPVYRHGFTYSPETGVQFLPFPGTGYQQYVRPTAINNAGQVVGVISTTTASQHVFVYSDADGLLDLNVGTMIDGLPAGYRLYAATEINNAGWIAGYGHTAQGKITGFVLKARGIVRGDSNCDGVVNNFDIDPFVLALTSPDDYTASFPNCDLLNADINLDGAVNNFDIDPFVACLANSGCQ
ncbi:MAG: hypothetical protein JNG88_17145 [Phycisphaerales bacterium]|nr:hypothetical protein [Phycisphaerales bacterium]